MTSENFSMPAAKRNVLKPFLIFLLGFAAAYAFAFLYYSNQSAVSVLYDLNGFGKIGRHLATGQGFSLDAGPTMRRAPLYPFFVGTILKIFGAEGEDGLVYRPVFFAQCLIVGACALLAYELGRRVFKSERSGTIAGILVAICPQFLRYVSMTEVETVMGLLTLLAAYTSLLLWEKASIRNGLLFALVCALSTLTKPMGLLYPFIFLGALVWRNERASRSNALKTSAASLAMFIALLLPWSVRNMIVSEGQYRGISTNASGEFIRGYVNVQPKYFLLKRNFGGGGEEGDSMIWDVEANDFEQGLMLPYGVSFYDPTRPASERINVKTNVAFELRKEKAEGRIVRQLVKENPFAVLRKFAIQLFTFWYIVETKTKSKAIGLMAGVVLLFCALGVLRGHKEKAPLTPVSAPLLYFYLLYAFILAFARYSFPLYPTLMVLAGHGVSSLFPLKKT